MILVALMISLGTVAGRPPSPSLPISSDLHVEIFGLLAMCLHMRERPVIAPLCLKSGMQQNLCLLGLLGLI